MVRIDTWNWKEERNRCPTRLRPMCRMRGGKRRGGRPCSSASLKTKPSPFPAVPPLRLLPQKETVRRRFVSSAPKCRYPHSLEKPLQGDSIPLQSCSLTHGPSSTASPHVSDCKIDYTTIKDLNAAVMEEAKKRCMQRRRRWRSEPTGRPGMIGNGSEHKRQRFTLMQKR